MSTEPITSSDERGPWQAKHVTYWSGRWEQLHGLVPKFRTDGFRAADAGPINPYMRSVIRLPRTQFEHPIPVGTVSNTYTLAQHGDVAEKCFAGIRDAGIETEELHCELGLTELGEWMNLRVYFPDRYSHKPKDEQTLSLRLECFNSVDGSCRLVILLGWLRLVCSNGLVIGESRTELRAVHDSRMDLDRIPYSIGAALVLVDQDRDQIRSWDSTKFQHDHLAPWVDRVVSTKWNKTAACRVYHICRSGEDVEIADPFARGEASTKPVRSIGKVPGAPAQAATLYDIGQAMSWVASRRRDPEERVQWQGDIPMLIDRLPAKAKPIPVTDSQANPQSPL